MYIHESLLYSDLETESYSLSEATLGSVSM